MCPRLFLEHEDRPCYADPHEGYALLASAVLVELVRDLESSNPKLRAQARQDVQEGSYAFWTAVLGLCAAQERRVRDLLQELAG